MPDLSPHPLQFAALPYREITRKAEVMLVSSRETKRWIIPKGWPMPGRKAHKTAEQEALEEAGVVGKVQKKPIATYSAWKRLPSHFVMVTVEVYALRVDRVLATWKEEAQRQRIWVPVNRAPELVDEPGLASLIATFAASLRA